MTIPLASSELSLAAGQWTLGDTVIYLARMGEMLQRSGFRTTVSIDRWLGARVHEAGRRVTHALSVLIHTAASARDQAGIQLSLNHFNRVDMLDASSGTKRVVVAG